MAKTSVFEKLLALDIFGKDFEFMLPAGKPYFKSMPGLIFSLMTVALMIAYSATRLQTLFERNEFTIMVESEDDYFVKNNFNMTAENTGF